MHLCQLKAGNVDIIILSGVTEKIKFRLIANKHQVQVLLNTFHFNGYNLGFYRTPKPGGSSSFYKVMRILLQGDFGSSIWGAVEILHCNHSHESYCDQYFPVVFFIMRYKMSRTLYIVD